MLFTARQCGRIEHVVQYCTDSFLVLKPERRYSSRKKGQRPNNGTLWSFSAKVRNSCNTQPEGRFSAKIRHSCKCPTGAALHKGETHSTYAFLPADAPYIAGGRWFVFSLDTGHCVNTVEKGCSVILWIGTNVHPTVLHTPPRRLFALLLFLANSSPYSGEVGLHLATTDSGHVQIPTTAKS